MNLIYIIATFLVAGGVSSYNYNHQLTIDLSKRIKGTAAILIVIGHFVSNFHLEKISSLNVGWYCVAIFFFLSGYGSAYGYINKKDYMKNYLKNRIVRVIFPFAGAQLIYLSVKVLLGEHFAWKQIMLSFIGSCEIAEFTWYPIAAILMYIIFWLIMGIKCDNSLKICLLAVAIIAITIVEWILLGEHRDYWYISNFAFAVGTVFCFLEKKMIKQWEILLASSGMYFLTMAIMPISNKIFGYYPKLIYIISCNGMSASLALFIIVLLARIGRKSTIMEWIGSISYEVYLFHGLFIWITLRYCNELPVIWNFIMISIGTTLTAYIMNKIFGVIIKNIIGDM